MQIRLASTDDLVSLARLRNALWPESTVEEHSKELEPILRGEPPGILPMVEFVASAAGGELVGFVEVGLRSHADGCDIARAVGYVEGWFVEEAHRRKGIGRLLVAAAEEWARAQGCVEMASDTGPENVVSQDSHKSLGYEVAGHAVQFVKKL